MTYILTITAKRKNAKRHILDRSSDIEYLRRIGSWHAKKIVEIYTANWKLVETINN